MSFTAASDPQSHIQEQADDDDRFHAHGREDEQDEHEEHHDTLLNDSPNYEAHIHVDRYLAIAVRASHHDHLKAISSKEWLATILRDNVILQRNEKIYAAKKRRHYQIFDLMFRTQVALAVGFLGMGIMLWKKW